MRNRCECRLTVIGSQRDVQSFRNSKWAKILHLRYPEPLEFSPCRFVCQFETVAGKAPHWPRLCRLSRSHPGLVLLLDYEVFPARIKGLAKARAGELEHCEIGY
jgi:hypothetical protein